MDPNNIFIKIFIKLMVISCIALRSEGNMRYLEPGSMSKYNPPPHSIGFKDKQLEIYCYKGKPKYMINIFNTINLRLVIENDDFLQYEGHDPEMVQAAFEDQRSIFSFNFLSSRKRLFKLNPFNQSCIGIEAETPFEIHMNLIRVDFWRVAQLAAGLFIFFSAATLSENALFYYLSGILVGISASILIVVYFFSKLIPRKPMMYGAMIGGWTLSFYFGQMIYENIRVILVTHQMYVFWYVFISGLISFVICYRMGPPKNPRSKNLIRWGLQLAAVLLIFYSSHFQEATVGINILITLIYHFPRRYISKGKTYWRRKFPPKRKLLSSEEFYEQGVRETTKALDELRNYCSSPEANPWRTMLKLKDPARFASFIEGNSHLEDNEILDYETTNANLTYTDNEDDSELSENENNYNHHDNEQDSAEISEDEDQASQQPPPPGWALNRSSRNGIAMVTPLRPIRNSTPIQQRSVSRQSGRRR